MITIDDFLKVEIRVGTVLEAEEIEGSEKLIKQLVDFGSFGTRQILSGIKKWYKPAHLVGKQFLYCVNLEPRKMMGFDSEGMIMAVDSEEDPDKSSPILLKPSKTAPNGAKIR